MPNLSVAEMVAAGLPATSGKIPIAIGVIGQSNEAGAVATTDLANYPRAFRSGRNPAVVAPLALAVTRGGGWWPAVYDDLYDYGYDTQILNGAIGGISFLSQAAGVLQNRADNFGYYAKRDRVVTSGGGDMGDVGDFMFWQTGGQRVFQCVVGRTRIALNTGPQLSALGTQFQSGIQTSGAAVTATGAPAALSTANVGDQVVDGGITWQCVATTLAGAYSGVLGSVLTEGQMGYGFDPLGVVQRLHQNMQMVRAQRKIIYIQNGQADLGIGPISYGNALQSLGQFYLNRGYDVVLGGTIYSPGSTGSTSTNYGNLETGRQNAYSALVAAYPGRVYLGPNLYNAMGTTGPMAAGGAYLQSDNIHLNGLGAAGSQSVGQPYVATGGVFPAAKYASDALKAILPQGPM